MTRHPFDPNELGGRDAELDPVAHGLERYAAEAVGEPPVDLVSRIRAAVDAQPHARGPIASLLAAWSGPTRAMVGAAAVMLIIVGAVALGQLIERTREQVGASPTPSVTLTPSPTPTPTASPTPSPTPSPTASPTPTPSPTPSSTPEASPSDDDLQPETPEPSDSDDSGGSDNSGPGGGGSDNSGPGGGD